MSVLSQLPEWFKATKPGKEMIAEECESMREQRQQLIDTKQRAIKADEKDAPKRQRARDDALAELSVKQDAAADAARKAREASQAISNASFRISSQVGAIDRQLRETADPRIAETRERWATEAERIRHTKLENWEQATGEYSQRTGVPVVKRHTNATQVVATLESIADAIGKLEALELENPADVLAAIGDITKDLPEIGA